MIARSKSGAPPTGNNVRSLTWTTTATAISAANPIANAKTKIPVNPPKAKAKTRTKKVAKG